MVASKLVFRDGVLQQGSFELILGDFAVTDGITLVQGPNGSGKSSLFRAGLGLAVLSRGQRLMASGVVMGYLPQQYRDALFPWHSAVIVVEMMSINIERAQLWLDRFGIGEVDMAKRPSQLSGGQTQRIALVKECTLGANMLFLDEPFSSMDVRSVSIAAELLREVVALGSAIVMTTHLKLPEQLAQHVCQAFEIVRIADDRAVVERR